MTAMTDIQTLVAIARQLADLYFDDLTVSERKIVNLLICGNYAKLVNGKVTVEG